MNENVPAIVETIDSREQRLESCERRIEAGFAEAGKAFREIRDNRLYPDHYGSGGFDAYCRERWGITAAYAYRLINAAEVMLGLGKSDGPLPRNELQANALRRLPEEDRPAAWAEVVDSSGRSGRGVSAKLVREVVACRAGENPPTTEAPSEVEGTTPSIAIDIERLSAVRIHAARDRLIQGIHTREDVSIIVAILDEWTDREQPE